MRCWIGPRKRFVRRSRRKSHGVLMSRGEFDIIARYFSRPASRNEVLLGIGDDAAVIAPPPDKRLVVAMDTIVEGIHFPVATAAADIGYRALAVNLSDLAAMGAEPAWMTLSLSSPAADEAWIAGFAGGMFELAAQHRVDLIGGDTVRGPLVVTVQIAGWVESDRWLTRARAQGVDRRAGTMPRSPSPPRSRGRCPAAARSTRAAGRWPPGPARPC